MQSICSIEFTSLESVEGSLRDRYGARIDPWQETLDSRYKLTLDHVCLDGISLSRSVGSGCGYSVLDQEQPCFLTVEDKPIVTNYGRKLQNIVEPGKNGVAIVDAVDHVLRQSGSQVFGLSLSQNVLTREIAGYVGRDIQPRNIRTSVIDLRSRCGTFFLWGQKLAFGEVDDVTVNSTTRLRHLRGLLLGLKEAFIGLLADHYFRVPNEAARCPVGRARDFIESRYGDEIGLHDIAAAAGVSGRSLQLAFLKRFGCTPTQYLRRVRMHRAREILVSGQCHSVTEVALQCGIYHFGRFARYYMQAFGELPSRTMADHKVTSH